MTKVDTFLAGQGRASRASLLRRPRRRHRVHPAVDADGHRRARARPDARAPSSWRPSTARTWTRRSRRAVTRRRLRFMGKDSLWKRQPVAVAAVGARRVPGDPRHGRPRGAEALHRRARGRRAARAVPGGRAQVRSDRAAALRRRRLRRPQGRRPDRAGRHRWVGGGDAQGRQVHPPAEGPRHRRAADPAAARRCATARSHAECGARGDRRAPLHAAAALRRGEAHVNGGSDQAAAGRRVSAAASQADRRRRTARVPSASTAAGRRRRRWRCRGGSR